MVTTNSYTSYENLSSVIAPSNASSIWLEMASYTNNNYPITIWMTGFLAPAISSEYWLFLNINNNNNVKFYLSNDSTSDNKV